MLTLEEIEGQLGMVAMLGGQGKVLAKKVQQLLADAEAAARDPFAGDDVVDAADWSCTNDEELDEVEALLVETVDDMLVAIDTTTLRSLLEREHLRARAAGAPTHDPLPPPASAIAFPSIQELREQFAQVIDRLADAEGAKTKKALLQEAAAAVRAHEVEFEAEGG